MMFILFRYLLGGQIAGESSVEGYIEALKMGCRCIERWYPPSKGSNLKGPVNFFGPIFSGLLGRPRG